MQEIFYSWMEALFNKLHIYFHLATTSFTVYMYSIGGCITFSTCFLYSATRGNMSSGDKSYIEYLRLSLRK
jgi:hypothetical protein